MEEQRLASGAEMDFVSLVLDIQAWHAYNTSTPDRLNACTRMMDCFEESISKLRPHASRLKWMAARNAVSTITTTVYLRTRYIIHELS